MTKPGRHGPRYFWQPGKALRKAGWRPRRLAEFAPPDEAKGKAIAEAQAINNQVKAWRAGSGPGPDTPKAKGKAVQPGSLAWVIRQFKASPRYERLAAETRKSYGYNFKILEAWAGDLPVKAISRGSVQTFCESLQAKTPAKAKMAVRVLRLVLKYAWDKGWVSANAAEKPGLIGTPPRVRIWTAEEIAALVAAADALALLSIGDAVALAADLGQRQGDLLALKWINYQDGRVRLRQSKRREHVDVPATPALAARLDAARARLIELGSTAPQILVSEATGRGYKRHHFRHVFADVRALAVTGSEELGLAPCPSLADAWFMDLRDTALTRLAAAGNSIPYICSVNICSVSGHSERSAYQILRHYVALNGDMASQAMANLVRYEDEQRKAAEK